MWKEVGMSCPLSFGNQVMEVSFINRKVIPNNVNDDLVNEKIRFKEMLVINSDGEQLGIKMRREALDIAFNQGLDLLCVAPKAQPPGVQGARLWKVSFRAAEESQGSEEKTACDGSETASSFSGHRQA